MRIPPVVVVAVALVAAATASAAAPRARSQATDDATDVYGGYSWTHAGEAGLHGWTLAASHPYADLRLVADLSGHYGTFAGAELSQYSLMAGVRGVWRRPSWRVRPFAETLVGFARTSASSGGETLSDTDWGLAFGGGADYPVDDRWSLRALLQLRLLRGGGALDKDPRVSVGVAYRLGR